MVNQVRYNVAGICTIITRRAYNHNAGISAEDLFVLVYIGLLSSNMILPLNERQ